MSSLSESLYGIILNMEIGQPSIQKVESLRTRRMVAVLYICTGAYVAFFERFFSSFETYFLADCEVHYFVFTDSELPIAVQNELSRPYCSNKDAGLAVTNIIEI